MTSTRVSAVLPGADAGRDPLHWFAASSDVYLGAARALQPWQLPEPYRTLLVHEGSMTARIERHFGGTIGLVLLSSAANASAYARWSLLLDEAGRCLEMGGVCLDLHAVSPLLRADILEGEQPLGRLLSRHRLSCESLPQSFFTITPAGRLQDLLQMREPCRVFGRRTTLRSNGQRLADVIEVLPAYEVQTAHAAAIAAVR